MNKTDLLSFFFNESMGQNIVSEFIGIGATVFLVDRIIKRREKQKTLPIRSIAYAKLYRISTSLLEQLLPFDFRRFSLQRIDFGKVSIFVGLKLVDFDEFKVSRELERDIKLSQEINPFFADEVTATRKMFEETIAALSDVVMFFYNVIDTDILNTLHQILFALDKHIKETKEHDTKTDDFAFLYAYDTMQIINMAVLLRTHLEKYVKDSSKQNK